MGRWVEIEFDCLPLRSVARWDAPLDASPEQHEFCRRIKAAADKHGSHNTYYLHNARCVYHLTNRPEVGMLEFRFDGVVMTDREDRHTVGTDLTTCLLRETCEWLTEPAVQWLETSVRRAVEVEFNRYVESGDLEKTRQRIEQLEKTAEQQGGFLGMYL